MNEGEYRWKRPEDPQQPGSGQATPNGPSSGSGENRSAGASFGSGQNTSNGSQPYGGQNYSNGSQSGSGQSYSNGTQSGGGQGYSSYSQSNGSQNYSGDNGSSSGGGSGPHRWPHPGASGSPKKPGKGLQRAAILIAAVVVLILSVVSNSFYELNEDEYAVITTLGKPSVVSTPGLKFKIPYIQQRYIVSKATKGFSIGYDMNTNQTISSESVMITVDYNFVDVDFYVEYRVTDPVKYLYNSEDPVGILKMLCQSYIRDTIGLYKVDDVITTGKSEIQSAIKEKILNRLDEEDIGITLVNITIQDAEPPTAAVQEAFKAVETAKQDAETAENNANKYANQVLPAAQADADEILQQAEAYKTSRINEANGQVSRFTQLYEEYSRYPEITRQRLFYETISEIFPDMKVVIMGEDGTELTTVLPLDEFASTASDTSASTGKEG